MTQGKLVAQIRDPDGEVVAEVFEQVPEPTARVLAWVVRIIMALWLLTIVLWWYLS